jgi:hypothetical protein
MQLCVGLNAGLETAPSVDTCAGVSMQVCGASGRLLLGTRDFEKGEYIVVDTPLIVSLAFEGIVEEASAQALAESWADRHGLQAASFLKTLSFLKGVGHASVGERKGLDDFFAPVCPPQLRPFLEVAEACANFPWGAGVSIVELKRAVLVFKCNAHTFSSAGIGHTAVFPIGSKINHSCDNNTFYSSTLIPGEGVWVALRRITSGEEITHSYIEPVYPATMRLQHLQQQYVLSSVLTPLICCFINTPCTNRTLMLYCRYAFTCSCRLCTAAPDVYRALPCPACGTPRLGPTVETPHIPPLTMRLLSDDDGVRKGHGFIRRDMGTEKWFCDRCDKTYGDQETGVPEAVEVLLLRSCYAVVTLLSRCCYTVVTLLLHCCCTVVTLGDDASNCRRT